jgi:hypothetical protein
MAYRGSGGIVPLSLNLGTRWWVVILAIRALYRRHPLSRRLFGPQNRLGRLEKTLFTLSGFEPRIVQPEACSQRPLWCVVFNPLNAELNPMCLLLILLGDLTFMGKCIVSISNKMHCYTVYLYLETAVHVSGGTSTHHQERIQLYLQHLVCVTPFQLFHDSGR